MLKVGRSLVGGLQGARGWESASDGKGGYFLERVQRGSCSSAEVSLWVCGSNGRGRAPLKVPAEHQTKVNFTLRTQGKASPGCIVCLISLREPEPSQLS